MTAQPLAIYPWPVTPFPIPENVIPVQAVPGGPVTVLALAQRPPWFCDAAVVPTPAGLPTAIEVVLSGQPDPRIHTAAQWLHEQIGAVEIDELQLRRENLDHE